MTLAIGEGRQQVAPSTATSQPDQAAFTALAERIDPYVAKPRLIVLTDIANEPDDQMSFVRLLVYSNQFDLEALIATTSRHLRNGPRPDVLLSVIDAYAKVQPNLLKHQLGFPTGRYLEEARRAWPGGIWDGVSRRWQDDGGRRSHPTSRRLH